MGSVSLLTDPVTLSHRRTGSHAGGMERGRERRREGWRERGREAHLAVHVGAVAHTAHVLRNACHVAGDAGPPGVGVGRIAEVRRAVNSIHMDWIPPRLHRGARRGAKLEDVVSVELHPFVHERIHARALQVGVAWRTVPPGCARKGAIMCVNVVLASQHQQVTGRIDVDLAHRPPSRNRRQGCEGCWASWLPDSARPPGRGPTGRPLAQARPSGKGGKKR